MFHIYIFKYHFATWKNILLIVQMYFGNIIFNKRYVYTYDNTFIRIRDKGSFRKVQGRMKSINLLFFSNFTLPPGTPLPSVIDNFVLRFDRVS